MTGATSAGMSKPFCASQLLSALESVEWSCTVAYGPDVLRLVTVTAGGAASCAPPLELDRAAVRCRGRSSRAAGGQFGGGATICVAVSASIESKSTSALRPTSTVPWIGSTHANDDGFPAYRIWS